MGLTRRNHKARGADLIPALFQIRLIGNPPKLKIEEVKLPTKEGRDQIADHGITGTIEELGHGLPLRAQRAYQMDAISHTSNESN